DGGDRPASVHRRRSVRPHGQSRPADERTAAADIQRHPFAARCSDRAGLGSGPDPGGAGPDTEPGRASDRAKERDMIRPESKTKESTDIETRKPGPMSTSGASPAPAQEAPDLSALGVKEGAGHAVKVKGLHAYYGAQHALKGID